MICSRHISSLLLTFGLVTPVIAQENLVLNGDFEDELNNWQWFGDGVSNVASLSTDTPSGTGFSADLDITEVLGLPWLVQDVPVVEGDNLVFSATVKEVRQFMPEFDAWIAAQIYMLPNSESGSILASGFTTYTDPNWETKGFDITVPAGATIARILFTPQDPDFGVGTGQYRIDDVRLELADSSGLDGDYNEDGTVDAADFTVWRDGYPDTYDLDDYQTWKDNFGMTQMLGSGSLAYGAVVPEPAALAIVATMLIAAFFQRPRSAARSPIAACPGKSDCH